MARKDEMATKEMKNLPLYFQQFVENIGNYLEKSILKIQFNILFQEKDSSIEISNIGRKFGIIFDENGNLILAKWINEISDKERKCLIDYILIRESYRQYYNQVILSNHPFERFTEIILQILAVLWYCENF